MGLDYLVTNLFTMSKHKTLRWAARVGGLLVTAFFGAFIIGEGVPDIVKGKAAELISFLPLLGIAFFGFFIAWFKPIAGGWVLLASGVLLFFYFIYAGDYGMSMVYGLPPMLIGLAFLGSENKEIV